MIMKDELIRRIREYFNLNIYETKVWVSLLSKGIASAGEVAEISGVPRSRTYDVLESLEKRGFAIVKIGKPVNYIAVKPTEIIEKIKSNTLALAQEKVKSLSNLKDTQEYTELEQIYNSGINPIKSQDITGAIRSRANIISRLRELIENAKKEVFICTSVQDFEDKSRAIIPVLEKAAKSNIKIKLALSGDLDKVKKFNLKHNNLKAKAIDSNARLFMADRTEVLLMITPQNSEEEMGVWLQSQFFTDSLINVIENSMKAQANGKK
jgi:HTH-type transcriptional regulator, sugar sensing transcriptional regulator